MTELHPMADPGPSPAALMLYRYICRYGGSIRMRTILRRAEDEAVREAVCVALDELAERYWIRLAWRKQAVDPAPGAPRPLDDIDRLTATRLGKRKGGSYLGRR